MKPSQLYVTMVLKPSSFFPLWSMSHINCGKVYFVVEFYALRTCSCISTGYLNEIFNIHYNIRVHVVNVEV